jgi:sortase A
LNNVKQSQSKPGLVAFLGIGLLVFGIGCISWAMYNILAQPDYSTPSSYTEEGVQVDSTLAHLLPSPDKTPNPVYLPESFSVDPTPVPIMAVPNKALYTVYPVEGDNIGSLSIPVLKQKLPIIQGTGVNELKKGVGHFIQSVLPGEADNCILSGHRDTVFAKLGKLKIGDELIVQTVAGTYTYEINRIRIVDKDDKTVIVPTGHAVLTLTTCYPFSFIGNAPDRFILIADLKIDD